MSFASIAFLFYFLPATAAICFALGFSRNAQNAWLFFAGLVFCAFGDPVTALALLVSVFACVALGLAVERARERGRRTKVVLAAACAFPLGLLFLVRYLPALLKDLPWAAGAVADGALPFLRPFGMAFFTLQALSYLMDVGRGEAAAERNPVSVGLSLAFFPRLLAGPILRHAEFAPQIRERRVTWEAFSDGVCRFAVGLGKVCMLAYPLRQAADYVFQMSALRASTDGGESVSALLAWLGLAAYALQLFHGFCGYSDMACGLSRMFGFTSVKNFDAPYTALSVTDFWRRWHISLSDWFRTYFWPPFDEDEGARGGRAAWYSLAVWLCIGLWHNATETCVIWALWHFFWLTAERVTRFEQRNVPSSVRRLYTLFTIGIGWIFFRAPDLWSAFSYLRDVFGLSRNAFADGAVLMLLREYWPVLLLGAFFAGSLPRRLLAFAPERLAGAWPAAVLRALALSVFFLGGLICLVRAGGAIWV